MTTETTLLETGSPTLPLDSSEDGSPLVLIIDDDQSVRLMARSCLENDGFEVVEADCAAEGLALFEELRPDVVLCDVVMPDMDGYQVCSRIRSSVLGADLPFIMLTGLDDIDSIERAYAVGATEFTVKPINTSLLPRRVRFVVRASEALEQCRRNEERYALAAKGANDGLWDWDISAGTVYYSPRWREILGLDWEIGDNIESWLSRIASEDEERVRMELTAHLQGRTEHFECEYRMECGGKEPKWVLSRGMATRDDSGNAVRMAGSMTDISVRKTAQQQLLHDALHDALTGLPNRNLFLDRLAHCIDIGGRLPGFSFAVLFLDLDRFKVVNDSMGHHTGDRMLIEIAQRIQTCLRRGDTIARFGGDEFTVLTENGGDSASVTRLAETLQRAISIPLELDGTEIVPTASIGIAMGGPEYKQPEEMLRDADVAMYRAKATGNGGVEVFDATMRMHAVQVLKTESALRTALAEKQLVPKYQPIYSLRTGELAGFEALIRWHHPARGLIRPNDFLEIAEESGLIVDIGREMVNVTCRQLADWRREFAQAQGWTISVNVASRDLDKADFVDFIDSVLDAVALPPNRLKLEVTERSLIQNDERAAAVLTELHHRGVKLAIDDFGTGYSSLSYLHRFPFDDLKVDQSFITGIEQDHRRAAQVKAIVQLAHNLELSVTAEGVESAASMEVLKVLRCECVQGHYLSRPIYPEELSRLLESESKP